MTTQRTEHNSPSNNIIHLIVSNGLFAEELDVFCENTMEQILEELADNLRLNSLSPQISFINARTGNMSSVRTITVEELGLINGDTLMMGNFSPDATIVFHSWIVNNTCYRIRKDQPKGRECYHELSLAFSDNSQGHMVTFYVSESNLCDIVAPWLWMPDYIGNKNSFTDGKKAMLIVNDRTGKCALPSEFDTLISDFVGSEAEPGRLFVILEDENVFGMHLDSFSFGE